MRLSLTAEIWSDVICPWCYIGKRRWEAAAAAFDGRWMVPGAQDADTFVNVVRRVLAQNLAQTGVTND